MKFAIHSAKINDGNFMFIVYLFFPPISKAARNVYQYTRNEAVRPKMDTHCIECSMRHLYALNYCIPID